jgi:(p)ppGpp synthase/HD superfamily hydrolase
MDLQTQAQIFATAAHAAIGQKRKYSGDDYIVHPARVASIVMRHGGTDEMVAAAWLHDTVEDTDVTPILITKMFGVDVADIVEGLTDISLPDDGNRAKRKSIDRMHSANASTEAQFVKCADIVDNSWDIAENDLSFAKVYKSEVFLLLHALTKVKHTEIWEQAMQSVELMP